MTQLRLHTDVNLVSNRRRRGFTLVELLVSMAILTLLASILLVGLAGVTEKAREDRTRTLIERLNVIIMDQWDSYGTRRAAVNLTNVKNQKARMQLRLFAIRELMRMEMPDNKQEVFERTTSTPPGPWITTPPASWLAYQQMAMRLTKTNTLQDAFKKWSTDNEGSECLYLILSRINDGDATALSQFKETEIVDTDGDGMPEIVDGWGRAILFVRWAPGFSTHPGADGAWGRKGVDDDSDGLIDNPTEFGAPGSDDISSPSGVHDRRTVRDEFDPLHVDLFWQNPTKKSIEYPFPLFPLIASAGPDKELGIYLLNNSNLQEIRMNSPYWVDPDSITGPMPLQVGTPDYETQTYLDNIHNQTL
ncbi:MAG: type II secretion system protein [Planctomycetota bacterium]|nr:type II secretion system protein [Planctomycetota bacterium]